MRCFVTSTRPRPNSTRFFCDELAAPEKHAAGQRPGNPAAVSFGFTAALWANGLARRWRGVLVGIAIVDLALPPFMVTNAWLHFLAGWVCGAVGCHWIFFAGRRGLDPGPANVAITFLLVTSAWRQLEPSQLESDALVTGWALVRALLWPLARQAVALAAVLTFVLALNNFAVPLSCR